MRWLPLTPVRILMEVRVSTLLVRSVWQLPEGRWHPIELVMVVEASAPGVREKVWDRQANLQLWPAPSPPAPRGTSPSPSPASPRSSAAMESMERSLEVSKNRAPSSFSFWFQRRCSPWSRMVLQV